MKITKEYLQSINACAVQVELFDKTFPTGTAITRAACKKATKVGLNLHWLASRLFDASARAAYEEAVASAFKAYDEARAPAFKAYNEACASALKAYDEARASAFKAYDEARGVAFHDAYKQQSSPRKGSRQIQNKTVARKKAIKRRSK